MSIMDRLKYDMRNYHNNKERKRVTIMNATPEVHASTILEQRKIEAMREYDKETDPHRKQIMRNLMDNGIYDFRCIYETARRYK